jgi:glutathione synthase
MSFLKPSLAVIMDPIQGIQPKKDTTLAILLKAQDRGFDLHYLEMSDLFLKYGAAFGITRPLSVFNDLNHWYELGEKQEQPLNQFDVILMRKDPPVDMEYIYATYILEQVESTGTLVLNPPKALRDLNEKFYATLFPQCMAPTIVSASQAKIHAFIQEQGSVVLKPLAGMGGRGIYKCQVNDPNINMIVEAMTQNGTRMIMAQQFLEEIFSGDKRIILIEGEPLPYALARIPKEGDFRGNLAAGGYGKGVVLSERDHWICEQIRPSLQEKKLLLVGIDVIGEYLTEINITSPTCVRELEAEFHLDITGEILDCIEARLEE